MCTFKNININNFKLFTIYYINPFIMACACKNKNITQQPSKQITKQVNKNISPRTKQTHKLGKRVIIRRPI
jgi:hypothetical protein